MRTTEERPGPYPRPEPRVPRGAKAWVLLMLHTGSLSPVCGRVQEALGGQSPEREGLSSEGRGFCFAALNFASFSQLSYNEQGLLWLFITYVITK